MNNVVTRYTYWMTVMRVLVVCLFANEEDVSPLVAALGHYGRSLRYVNIYIEYCCIQLLSLSDKITLPHESLFSYLPTFSGKEATGKTESKNRKQKLNRISRRSKEWPYDMRKANCNLCSTFSSTSQLIINHFSNDTFSPLLPPSPSPSLLSFQVIHSVSFSSPLTHFHRHFHHHHLTILRHHRQFHRSINKKAAWSSFSQTFNSRHSHPGTKRFVNTVVVRMRKEAERRRRRRRVIKGWRQAYRGAKTERKKSKKEMKWSECLSFTKTSEECRYTVTLMKLLLFSFWLLKTTKKKKNMMKERRVKMTLETEKIKGKNTKSNFAFSTFHFSFSPLGFSISVPHLLCTLAVVHLEPTLFVLFRYLLSISSGSCFSILPTVQIRTLSYVTLCNSSECINFLDLRSWSFSPFPIFPAFGRKNGEDWILLPCLLVIEYSLWGKPKVCLGPFESRLFYRKRDKKARKWAKNALDQ